MNLVRKLVVPSFIIIVIIGAFSIWLYFSLNSPVEHKNNEKYVVINHGSTPNQIIEVLESKNIIQSALATKLYLRLVNKDATLQAGDYVFPSPISPVQAIRLLQKGKKRTENFTVPEGWTRFEIAQRIAERFPEPSLHDEEILAMMDDTSLIQDIDSNAVNLEGYLYPSTYQIETGTPAEEIIARMVQQFRRVWQPAWNELARERGRTQREIMIIASLIENESTVDEERPLIASVIYNRLERQIPLGIDATNVYIARLQDRWDGIIHKSDVEVDHPYNTRKIRGLPPGPISSPSQSAIAAALNPARTDYLYYVLNVEKNNGSHHFYATGTEFSKGKEIYQIWLKKQRGN